MLHTFVLESLANGPLRDSTVSGHRHQHLGMLVIGCSVVSTGVILLNPAYLPDSASVFTSSRAAMTDRRQTDRPRYV